MYPFESLRNAASFALRCKTVALVFDGPAQGGGSGSDYIVALGQEARELLADGHIAYSLQETALAAGEGEEKV